MSNSSQPHELQHARFPCPSSTPQVCSDSCALSQGCHPTISSSVIPFSTAFNLSQHQGIFQWVSSSYQVAKFWSFGFSISPSNEYSRLISFRMDWLDLLAVQGTLKSLLQHHSSKASILPLYLPYKIRFPVERVEISLMLRSSLSLWLSKMITKLSYSIF